MRGLTRTKCGLTRKLKTPPLYKGGLGGFGAGVLGNSYFSQN